jgi:hypothetical protein
MMYLVMALFIAGGFIAGRDYLGHLRWFGPALVCLGAWMFAGHFERRRP